MSRSDAGRRWTSNCGARSPSSAADKPRLQTRLRYRHQGAGIQHSAGRQIGRSTTMKDAHGTRGGHPADRIEMCSGHSSASTKARQTSGHGGVPVGPQHSAERGAQPRRRTCASPLADGRPRVIVRHSQYERPKCRSTESRGPMGRSRRRGLRPRVGLWYSEKQASERKMFKAPSPIRHITIREPVRCDQASRADEEPGLSAGSSTINGEHPI